MRILLFSIVSGLVFLAIGCGGGGSSSSGNNPIANPANNVQPVTAGGGPAGIANGVFTTISVCSPGSATNCATVSGVLVDTGSSGLRILSSALPAGFTFPRQTDASGNPVVECFQFVDGFTWGPVQTADIHLAGETANSAAIQVIGDPGSPAIPAACASSGPSEQSVQTLGANGILGIGNFRQDCGGACTLTGAGNPGLYYTCPAAGCQITSEGLTQQLQQPVALFAGDNNGVIVELPSLPGGEAASVNGSLVFGIGTQSNNGLGAAAVLTLDARGNFTTVFKTQTITASFVDSGSNGLFFLNSATTGLPVCTNNSFYCPPTPQNFTATTRGTNGASTAVNFTVGNADSFLSAANPNFLFNGLAAPNPNTFDWGLPFFFGRNVFTAIEAQNTPAGPGPYTAF